MLITIAKYPYTIYNWTSTNTTPFSSKGPSSISICSARAHTGWWTMPEGLEARPSAHLTSNLSPKTLPALSDVQLRTEGKVIRGNRHKARHNAWPKPKISLGKNWANKRSTGFWAASTISCIIINQLRCITFFKGYQNPINRDTNLVKTRSMPVKERLKPVRACSSRGMVRIFLMKIPSCFKETRATTLSKTTRLQFLGALTLSAILP